MENKRASSQNQAAAMREDVESLRQQLQEAQETLEAIRTGAVDALVVDTPAGQRIFTLEGAETIYRALVEQMAEGAVILNSDGTLHYCNQRFADLLELPLEKVIGQPIRQWIASADELLLADLLAEGSGRKELRLRSGAGRETPVLMSAVIVPGGISFLCLVVTDLTELKENEARILRLNEELEQRVAQRTRDLEAAKQAAETASQAKSHFLAVLSHELRNPLNAVLATSSLLRHDPNLKGELREHLEVIHRNTELEARLIDDLLDVTRIERGKVQLQRRRVDLCTIVNRAAEVCQEDIQARRIEFYVQAPDPTCILLGDAARLQQVFWNLIKNAIKFTPPGGCVGVYCGREGNQAIIQVQDSGEGIDPGNLNRIFNAFEQSGPAITRQFGGLGLGLAISKALVELHGGTIEAMSEGIGKGATFIVKLPLADVDATALNPARAGKSDVPPFPRLKILLVEDHADTARIMKRLLSQDGHQIEIAHDMASALELADKQDFDLLLSDLGLPDGSGVELVRTLKARGSRLPAIALSGYGQVQDMQDTTEAGFSAHLIKPIDYINLQQAIAQVMGGFQMNFGKT